MYDDSMHNIEKCHPWAINEKHGYSLCPPILSALLEEVW